MKNKINFLILFVILFLFVSINSVNAYTLNMVPGRDYYFQAPDNVYANSGYLLSEIRKMFNISPGVKGDEVHGYKYDFSSDIYTYIASLDLDNDYESAIYESIDDDLYDRRYILNKIETTISGSSEKVTEEWGVKDELNAPIDNSDGSRKVERHFVIRNRTNKTVSLPNNLDYYGSTPSDDHFRPWSILLSDFIDDNYVDTVEKVGNDIIYKFNFDLENKMGTSVYVSRNTYVNTVRSDDKPGFIISVKNKNSLYRDKNYFDNLVKVDVSAGASNSGDDSRGFVINNNQKRNFVITVTVSIKEDQKDLIVEPEYFYWSANQNVVYQQYRAFGDFNVSGKDFKFQEGISSSSDSQQKNTINHDSEIPNKSSEKNKDSGVFVENTDSDTVNDNDQTFDRDQENERTNSTDNIADYEEDVPKQNIFKRFWGWFIGLF